MVKTDTLRSVSYNLLTKDHSTFRNISEWVIVDKGTVNVKEGVEVFLC